MASALGSSLQSNQVNQHISTALKAYGIEPKLSWCTPGCLLNFLFDQPNEELKQAVQPALKAMNTKGVVVVGVHIRMEFIFMGTALDQLYGEAFEQAVLTAAKGGELGFANILCE
jgi:hypothetical protein